MLKYKNIRTFLLTMALGLVAVTFGRWAFFGSSNVSGDVPGPSLEILPLVSEEETPLFVASGESGYGMTEGGGTFCSVELRAGDSSTVMHTLVSFPNEDDAEKHLDRYLQRDGRVVFDSRKENGRHALPVYLILVQRVGKRLFHTVVWYQGGDSYRKARSTELKMAIRFLDKPELYDLYERISSIAR